MLLQNKDVVAKLQKEGFKFRDLVLKSEGNYNVADADWNYRDLLHLRHVHATDCTILSNYDDSTCQILWPKMFGVRLPMQLLSYRPAPNKHSAVSIWICFALTSEDTFLPISPNWTRVITRYRIGAPRFLSFLLPVIAWLLRRSYKKLMSEDIPMRTRRGELRFWGYQFKHDQQGHGFVRTSTLETDEVIAPKDAFERFDEINISKDIPDQQNYYVGKDDHLGLRIHRKDEKLYFYPRLCPHAGASLDGQDCSGNKVRCPWHGKVFQPSAILALSHPKQQVVETQYHNLRLSGNTLKIEVKQPEVVKEENKPSAQLDAAA